jgi:hypothetical protein
MSTTRKAEISQIMSSAYDDFYALKISKEQYNLLSLGFQQELGADVHAGIVDPIMYAEYRDMYKFYNNVRSYGYITFASIQEYFALTRTPAFQAASAAKEVADNIFFANIEKSMSAHQDVEDHASWAAEITAKKADVGWGYLERQSS